MNARQKYTRQCALAIREAMAKDDPLRQEIERARCRTLEEFNEQFRDSLPVHLVVADYRRFEGRGRPLRPRLSKVLRFRRDSRMARIYLAHHQHARTHKPVALFIRQVEQPVHVVVHNLAAYRSWQDREVLANPYLPDVQGVMVERRSDFCRLLTNHGGWAQAHRQTLPAIDHEDVFDVRHWPPEQRLEVACNFLKSLGIRPTWELAYKHLSDQQLIAKAMQMRVARRKAKGMAARD